MLLHNEAHFDHSSCGEWMYVCDGYQFGFVRAGQYLFLILVLTPFKKYIECHTVFWISWFGVCCVKKSLSVSSLQVRYKFSPIPEFVQCDITHK